MTLKKIKVNINSLLKEAFNTLLSHPLILFPFITIVFIRLLLLEILYFFPRTPLIVFFGPIVEKLWEPSFLHYPFNFILVSKLFQNFQYLLFICVDSFLIATAIAILYAVNNHKPITFRSALRNTLSQYIHIIVSAFILAACFYGLHHLYEFAIMRFIKMGSVGKVFFILKTFMEHGAPYLNLLLSIFISTLFAFVLPIIVIEKKKVFSAIGLNFKNLWGSLRVVFMVVLIPTLLYIPVLLLRNHVISNLYETMPEVRVLVLIASTIILMFVDALVYTAVTIYYLVKKEGL